MKRFLNVCLVLIYILVVSPSWANERPQVSTAWPMRYAIYVDTERWYQARVDAWRENPLKYIRIQGFFPAFFVKTQGVKERLAAMYIDFDEQGKVLTKTLNNVPLRGSIKKDIFILDSLPGATPSWVIKTHSVWEQRGKSHLPVDEEKWEFERMTFCDIDEYKRMQTELLAEEDGPAFDYKLEPEEGIFYCNDWSKQLANPDRPWIDVTSYEKRGPRVRKFQGYGKFGVTKPVVGKHYKTWICFADCPDGKPGTITDINAWSKKYNLPVQDKTFGM